MAPLAQKELTLSCVILKNDRTLKDLAVWTLQDVESMFGHLLTLWKGWLWKKKKCFYPDFWFWLFYFLFYVTKFYSDRVNNIIEIMNSCQTL